MISDIIMIWNSQWISPFCDSHYKLKNCHLKPLQYSLKNKKTIMLISLYRSAKKFIKIIPYHNIPFSFEDQFILFQSITFFCSFSITQTCQHDVFYFSYTLYSIWSTVECLSFSPVYRNGCNSRNQRWTEQLECWSFIKTQM